MNPPDAQGHWGSTNGLYGTGMVETLPRSGVSPKSSIIASPMCQSGEAHAGSVLFHRTRHHTLYTVYIPSTKQKMEALQESLGSVFDAMIAACIQEKPLGSIWYGRYGNLVEPDETKRVDERPSKFAAPTAGSSPITPLSPH